MSFVGNSVPRSAAPTAKRGCQSSGEPRRLRASHVEIVEVQRRIEQQEKLALRLMTPHRIGREHYNVTTTDRHIDDRRTIREFIRAREHATDEQILFIRGKTQHDARSQLRWREKRPLPLILIRIGTIRRIRGSGLRHRLDYVGIAHATAS